MTTPLDAALRGATTTAAAPVEDQKDFVEDLVNQVAEDLSPLTKQRPLVKQEPNNNNPTSPKKAHHHHHFQHERHMMHIFDEGK